MNLLRISPDTNTRILNHHICLVLYYDDSLLLLETSVACPPPPSSAAEEIPPLTFPFAPPTKSVILTEYSFKKEEILI